MNSRPWVLGPFPGTKEHSDNEEFVFVVIFALKFFFTSFPISICVYVCVHVSEVHMCMYVCEVCVYTHHVYEMYVCACV